MNICSRGSNSVNEKAQCRPLRAQLCKRRRSSHGWYNQMSRSSRTLVPIYKCSIRDLRPRIWSAPNKTLNLSQSSVWNLNLPCARYCFHTPFLSGEIRRRISSEEEPGYLRPPLWEIWRRPRIYVCALRERVYDQWEPDQRSSGQRTRFILHIIICLRSHMKGNLDLDVSEPDRGFSFSGISLEFQPPSSASLPRINQPFSFRLNTNCTSGQFSPLGPDYFTFLSGLIFFFLYRFVKVFLFTPYKVGGVCECESAPKSLHWRGDRGRDPERVTYSNVILGRFVSVWWPNVGTTARRRRRTATRPFYSYLIFRHGATAIFTAQFCIIYQFLLYTTTKPWR